MTNYSKPALAVVALLGSYLLFTSTLFPLDFLGVFDAKRVLQLVLFVAILIFAVAWAPLRTSTTRQLSRLSIPIRYALGLFFLIGIASSLRLEHPAYALVDVSMMLVIMILIAVTAASRNLSGERFDKFAVLLLAAMGLAVATQELMGFAAGWAFGSEFSYEHALIHFAHPRFYNQLQTWSIPTLAALPLLFPHKRWIKIGCVFLIGLQWFLVIALAARGTAISLFIAMVFIALWIPAHRGVWLKFQLGGLIVGNAIYFGIIFLNGALIPKSESGEFYAYSVGRPMAHTSGRSTFWRLSINDAIKHPLLGSGPTRFACDSELVLPAHPHNFPLRILGEWGMIAFVLFLMLAITIGLAFLKNLKYRNEESLTDPPLKAIVGVSLIAGIIHACLSGLLIMPASQVALIIAASWALSLSGETPPKLKKPAFGNILIVTALLLASTTFLFATTEIAKPPENKVQPDPSYRMAPRFWQDGRACGIHRAHFFNQR